MTQSQEDMLWMAFLNNLKVSRKDAKKSIAMAQDFGFGDLVKLMELRLTEAKAQITTETHEFFTPFVDIKGSELDINNHELFDLSNITKCAVCNRDLVHKKSVSIGIGPECSGLKYSNSVNWNKVIEKMTSKRWNYYKQVYTYPKYEKLENLKIDIVAKSRTKKEYIIKILGKYFVIQSTDLVYIPKTEWSNKERIDEKKRMTKNNTKYIKEENQDTLLINTWAVRNNKKIQAFLRLQNYKKENPNSPFI